jgi:hypothetical protein
MSSRTVWAGAAALIAFSAAVAASVRLMGDPLLPVDYFLSGTIGTFVGLVALFVGLVKPSDWRNVFYKARRFRPKQPRSTKTLGI